MGAELAQKVAVGLENLHAMVARIGDDDVALGVDSYALRTEKLAVSGTFRTQETGRLEIRIDDQQPMVVEIRHHDVAFVVEADTSRRVEMFPQRPLKAVLVEESAIWCEELDPMVAGV